MKKMIAIFALLSMMLSLTACKKEDQSEPEVLDPFAIAETKDIKLGNEVDSVVLTTAAGDKITVDNSADFYEIYNSVRYACKEGTKHSYTAEVKLEDQSKSFVNMNIYYLGNAEYYEYKAKKDGDDAIASAEEYSSSKLLEDNSQEIIRFHMYTYKDEKAFGGEEHGKNGLVRYFPEEYPIIPSTDTELGDMHARLRSPINIINLSGLFVNPAPIQGTDKTYDFNDFITREYKLYKNYIVFKQTAPFLGVVSVGIDPEEMYTAFRNSECSITQEAYCNIKTGEIEMIKVYGNMRYQPGYWETNLEINLEIYVNKADKAAVKSKVENLLNYIKSNAA